MKMNKDKPHWRVTFNCNSDARNNCTVDVWASSIKKAGKIAAEIMKKKTGIFFFTCTGVEFCEDNL